MKLVSCETLPASDKRYTIWTYEHDGIKATINEWWDGDIWVRIGDTQPATHVPGLLTAQLKIAEHFGLA